MWSKIKAACRHSLTVAWGYFQLACAVAFIYADQGLALIAKAAGDPDVAAKIQQLSPPSWLPYLVAAMGVITLVARLRSLLKVG